jgi:putative protease
MLELLSPAGSPEAVTAAVQSGADAVYLGYGDFNARRNAKNFSERSLRRRFLTAICGGQVY